MQLIRFGGALTCTIIDYFAEIDDMMLNNNIVQDSIIFVDFSIVYAKFLYADIVAQ